MYRSVLMNHVHQTHFPTTNHFFSSSASYWKLIHTPARVIAAPLVLTWFIKKVHAGKLHQPLAVRVCQTEEYNKHMTVDNRYIISRLMQRHGFVEEDIYLTSPLFRIRIWLASRFLCLLHCSQRFAFAICWGVEPRLTPTLPNRVTLSCFC